MDQVKSTTLEFIGHIISFNDDEQDYEDDSLTYWEVVKKNCVLFDPFEVLLETLRQWFVIFMSIGLSIWFIQCAHRMRKSQQRITFDFIIIVIETAKLILYMLSQFLLLDVSLLMMCWVFQSTVRMLVCLYFISVGLHIIDKESLIRPMQIGYSLVIGLLLAIVLIVSVTSSAASDCESKQWHWYILVAIDTLQCLFIIGFACKLLKPGLLQEDSIRKGSVSGMGDFKNNLLSTQDHEKCFILQVKVLVGFYCLCTIIDWSLVLLMDHFLESGALACINSYYIIVADTAGAFYLGFYSMCIYAYALMMLTVFYLIPQSHKLISFQHRGSEKLPAVIVRGDSVVDDQNIKEFLVAQVEQDNFESTQLNSSRNTVASEDQEELLSSKASQQFNQNRPSQQWLSSQEPKQVTLEQEEPAKNLTNMSLDLEAIRQARIDAENFTQRQRLSSMQSDDSQKITEESRRSNTRNKNRSSTTRYDKLYRDQSRGSVADRDYNLNASEISYNSEDNSSQHDEKISINEANN